jgi:UTP:GlnB (protein PII) uridylyltransferase
MRSFNTLTLIFPQVSSTVLPLTLYQAFWHAIATEEETAFLAASEAGMFSRCLPEWERMRGNCNTQHATHEFTLDVHTAKVLTKTRTSPYFQLLSADMQELATLAALLHDIAKEGGAASKRLHLKPDMAHPVKAVSVVRSRLPQWGFTQYAVEVVSLLVAYHQAFGRWIMRSEFQQKEPTFAEIQALAEILRSTEILHALQALTEGDIRGVKANDALFTPFATQKLHQYGIQVQQAIEQIEQQTAYQYQTLQHALQQCDNNDLAVADHTLWLLPTITKPVKLPQHLQVTHNNNKQLVAVLPNTVLVADIDAKPCHQCELKNQASSRVFTVSLICKEQFNPSNYFRVFVLPQSIIGWEQNAEGFLLYVQNPIALQPVCNTISHPDFK